MLRMSESELSRLTRAGKAGRGSNEGQAAKLKRRPPRQATAAAPRSAVQSVTFDLPLPPTGCSSNSSGESRHWRGHAEATAAYRAECLALLPRVNTPMFARATITLEFWYGPAPGRYRAKDTQRAIAATAALTDAIVDAGYLVDDNARVLEWGPVAIRGVRESAGRSGVVVVLTRKETT